ncbi:MAG: nuclear transport factor 2 family protein [Thermoleophilaceae bacterium]|nr:nuclear transport factor 2 family protein [Thermoleophilaceae bacterium]
MPSENLTVFLRAVDALNRHDVEAVLADVTDDVVLIPLRSRLLGAFRGHEGVRAFFADTEESFEVFEARYDEIREFGDFIVAIGRTRIRAKGSGVETSVTTAGVTQMRDGRIARWEDHGERGAALASLRT